MNSITKHTAISTWTELNYNFTTKAQRSQSSFSKAFLCVLCVFVVNKNIH